MRLIVVHNHFRPGGVRRVLEMATPWLARGLRPRRVEEVLLVGGERPDEAWLRQFEAAMEPIAVRCRADHSLLYLAEQRRQPGQIGARLHRFLDALLRVEVGTNSLVWAHNQGLGRNILLARELQDACGARGIRLVLHHHDWWFDNRWERWEEMRSHGFRTLAAVARAVFGSRPGVSQVAINRADAAILRRHFGRRSAWIPNPAGTLPAVTSAKACRARSWLTQALGGSAPVWLMPCRLIRRKNIAEALLLTRWLRPEAWLVTTGGVSSKEELTYASRLEQNALRHQWRLRLGILKNRSNGQPSVFELMSASEVVVLTSLQEGFGLPYLEAPAVKRPLIARSLPNVMPDLAQFGFKLPQTYDETWIDPSLFDWRAELARQRRLYARWRERLPGPCRRLAAKPWLLRHAAAPTAIPFSRLTLTAQLEILSAPVEVSWERCAALNQPWLPKWRLLAGRGALTVTPWPARAAHWLGAPAYARQFHNLIESPALAPIATNVCVAAQQVFIRQKLATENLYPLSWSPST